jgi:hypothetical protein
MIVEMMFVLDHRFREHVQVPNFFFLFSVDPLSCNPLPTHSLAGEWAVGFNFNAAFAGLQPLALFVVFTKCLATYQYTCQSAL